MIHWIASRRALLARGALVPAAGLAVAVSSTAAFAAQSKNIELILTFCKAGQDRDVEKQMTFIDADSVYHNMPDDPIVGAAGIRALLSSYVTTTEASEIIVHNISEAKSGTVMTERVDRFRVKGGKWIECPVMGAADIKDGKIKVWRDYYDNGYLNKQMG